MVLREVMTIKLVTVGQEQSVGSALGIMRRFKIRHLIVTDNTGSLAGLASERDLKAAAPSSFLGNKSRETDVLERKVKDTMIKNPAVATPATSLEEAAKLMVTRRIGCLPIVDGSARPVGIVTTTDVLAAVAGLKGPPAPAGQA